MMLNFLIYHWNPQGECIVLIGLTTLGVVINYGEGGYKMGGGASSDLPLRKRAANIFLAMRGWGGGEKVLG